MQSVVPRGLESFQKKVPGCVWVLRCHVCISLPDFPPPGPHLIPSQFARGWSWGPGLGPELEHAGKTGSRLGVAGGLLHLQSQVGTPVCQVSLLESASQGHGAAGPGEILEQSCEQSSRGIYSHCPNGVSCSEGRCWGPGLLPWRAHLLALRALPLRILGPSGKLGVCFSPSPLSPRNKSPGPHCPGLPSTSKAPCSGREVPVREGGQLHQKRQCCPRPRGHRGSSQTHLPPRQPFCGRGAPR